MVNHLNIAYKLFHWLGRDNHVIFLLANCVFFHCQWILELRHHCPTTPIILVGTKKDLRDDKKTKFSLDKSEGELMAYRLEADSYVECSSYNMDNVDAVFRYATKAALFKPKRRKKRRCRLLWKLYSNISHYHHVIHKRILTINCLCIYLTNIVEFLR